MQRDNTIATQRYKMNTNLGNVTQQHAPRRSWHSFLDPKQDNVYASSITIFGGDEKTNILNEDYHVVHHQYRPPP
jgi:hypothetical protein